MSYSKYFQSLPASQQRQILEQVERYQRPRQVPEDYPQRKTQSLGESYGGGYDEEPILEPELQPKNWRALANRRVPWPKDLDPELALAQMMPFLKYHLLNQQAAAMGRPVDMLIDKDQEL